MNAQKFTQKSLEAIQDAQYIAIQHQNIQIEQEHLLYALIKQEGGLIGELLTKMNINGVQFKSKLEKIIDGMPRVTGPGREAGKIYVSGDVDRVLVDAENQADRMKDEYVSVEHLFLALLDEKNSSLKAV